MWDSDFCLEGGSLPHNDAASCWILLVQRFRRISAKASQLAWFHDVVMDDMSELKEEVGVKKTMHNDAHPQETSDLPAINIDKYRYFHDISIYFP